MFHPQSFAPSDLGVVAFLVALEALLSADNALVLAIMVRHLPHELRQKSLLYGLGGAFIFRFVAILLATYVISLWWLQAIGALYLLYLPVRHFRHVASPKEVHEVGKGFWPTVVAVEVADIAFAIDSVLAAVSTVGDHSEKLWVVYSGAIIGVIMLRFAAGAFIRLLEKFPSLDHVAYVIVGWVGIKLAMMATHNFGEFFEGRGIESPIGNIPEIPPHIFWSVLLVIAVGGFWAAVKRGSTADESLEEVADEAKDAEDMRIDGPKPRE